MHRLATDQWIFPARLRRRATLLDPSRRIPSELSSTNIAVQSWPSDPPPFPSEFPSVRS
ncbi:hypothetical protein M6B38_377580 [Iris pallida]|uniref:Uncharacterized protein n=1 Tax=Iris pallida TaxID=29817 RepID=A0AAX6GBS4_IRIPA|nr:hypothetical protein M6B38_377580 [Iris pallida]